jgi:hypothetical protein
MDLVHLFRVRFFSFSGHTSAESKDLSSLNPLELGVPEMKQITLSLLASALLIGSYSQGVQAQYVSSTQARELLQELQDARSVTKVGISWLEYGKVARNIQIKLDRFLRTPDASRHPVGFNLKNAAELYVLAHSSSAKYWDPSGNWRVADRQLNTIEKCIVNTKLLECSSIALAKQRGARDTEFYNLLISKNPSYESLLKKFISISKDSLNVSVYTTENFTNLSRGDQNSITQIILKEARSFLNGNQVAVTIYDSNYKELLTVRH